MPVKPSYPNLLTIKVRGKIPPLSGWQDHTRYPPPWGWSLQRNPTNGELHLIPYLDTLVHYLDEECACGPMLDEDGFCSHNAGDRRERYEQGVARPH